ncbi:MAG: exopolysaccharide biosynthesis protein [Pseudomonadota bacterium]
MQDNPTDKAQGHAISDMLDQALSAGGDSERISIGDLLAVFSSRGFGPLLLLFALVALLPPLGGVPLIPTTMGALIGLTSAQMLFGAKHPWVPKWLKNKSVSRELVATTRERGGSWLGKIDALICQRWDWATGPAGRTIAALACLLLALQMPPLELLPFAVAVPSSVVALFGLSIMARDGVLMVIAMMSSAVIFFYLMPVAFNLIIGFFS